MIRIQDITLGQYALRESVIHRLDPRTKVLSSLFFMLCVFFIHHLDISIVMMIFSLAVFILAKLNPVLLLKNLRAFWVLFLLTFFVHALFTPGRIIWRIPWVTLYVTEEGYYYGIFYSLRLGILISLANLLTLTTSPMDLTDALERFLKPFRRFGVPSHEIGMMFSISLRFIPILIDEAERIRKAQLSRGARHEGNIFHKIRSIVPLIIPLFLSAFRRAHDLALAMDARCYQGGANRTSYYLLKFKKIDGLAFLTVLFIGLPILVLGNR